MKTKHYLIFNLHNIQYGIEANLVKEILQLPELNPIAEAPIDIVGILNLRDKFLPVMHLDLRLGNSLKRCELTDNIIVLNWENLEIGIIVNTVDEVVEIEPETIQEEINYGRTNNVNPAFIAGMAKIDDSVIILLNSEALIRQPDAVKALVGEANSDLEENRDQEETIQIISNFYEVCCPDVTPKEKSMFRRRADNLRRATVETSIETTEQIPLAVISLNNEYFGLALETVKEFINICNFVPIPGCPQHILGNINLRGEIVTLVDLRSSLNLPITSMKNSAKAVLIQIQDIVAGLPVDEVFDVIYLPQTNINPLPVAVESSSHEYLRGTATYADKILSIIDLSKIINQGHLEVNETA